MTISERIKRFRRERGFTQKELGILINKSSQVISNWERGYTTTINHDDITNLSKILKKSIDEIVGSDFKEIPPVLHEYISPEELELLRQIRQASADKQKAIELILGIKEQAAASSDK